MLNVCIQNNNFRINRYFGSIFICQNQESEIFGETIDEHNFYLIQDSYFGLKPSEMFNKLFDYLNIETQYFPAIPLHLLTKRIKSYHSKRLKTNRDHTNSSNEMISLEEIVSNGLGDIKKKLEGYYVQVSKLEQSDADLIYNSFVNISKDMLNGGIHDSLYIYLKDHNKNLTKEIFARRYLHIMSYLLSRFKNNVTQNLHFYCDSTN